MASIILKKRKLCEAIEEGLQITPASFDVKRRIDENGEYKQLYESILPQLKGLFPDFDDSYLLETLKTYKNDIVSAIEHLKYYKPSTPNRLNLTGHINLDENIMDALDQLSVCQDRAIAYEILSRFKQQIINGYEKEKNKLNAENIVLRKVFVFNKNVIKKENEKTEKCEEIIERQRQEIDHYKMDISFLNIKLEQMEKSATYNFSNNQVF